MQAQNPAPNLANEWASRLEKQFLAGDPLDTASEACCAAGIDPDAVRQELRTLSLRAHVGTVRSAAIRVRCRDWLLRVYATLAELDGSASAVDERPVMPREQFQSDYYVRNRSVLFRRLAANWRALARWNEEYLTSACGNALVEVMMGRDKASTYEHSVAQHLKQQMPFSQFVSLVYSGGVTNNYYIVSRNGFFGSADTRVLLDDIDCPPYVRISGDGRHVKMWFGPAGTITPLHHDDRNNLIVQILGRKRVRLYAPYYADKIPQSRPFYADAEPAPESVGRGPGASAKATDVLLEAGDALFIPVGWWHAVESLDISITLAFTDFGVHNEYGWP